MPDIPGLNVSISKRGIVLLLVVFVLLVTAMLLGGNGDSRGDVHEGAEDCIEYVRRGCCQEPDLERCQTDEIGWTREEDPFEFCCDETMT